MSITERQKKLVQRSFVQIEPHAEEAAELFYQTLSIRSVTQAAI